MTNFTPRIPAHVTTTRHLCAAYPLVSEAGLGHEGVLIGRDVLGGSFVYDPFVLYRQGVVTNPNMVVFGQIGRGKSSFVKSYLWRQAVFGRRAWVIDPKGEYGPLADAWGVAPVALRPGGPVRLNPLDTGEPADEAVGHAGTVPTPGPVTKSCVGVWCSPPRWRSPASCGSCSPASGRQSMPLSAKPPDALDWRGCRHRPFRTLSMPSSPRASMPHKRSAPRGRS